MNRTFIAVCGAVIVSAALVSAQGKSSGTSSSNAKTSDPNTVTFTGCLGPGSTADTYYLTSAKQKGAKNSDKTVKLVAAKKGSLEPFVRQEVEVTGTIDQQTRTLTVTKVKPRADSCA